MKKSKRLNRYHDYGIWAIAEMILLFLLKIISFPLSIVLVIAGIFTLLSMGNATPLMSLLELPLGFLLIALGVKLFRWFSGRDNYYMGYITFGNDINEAWDPSDYH